MIARFLHTLHICFRPHLWLLYLVLLASGISIGAFVKTWPIDVTRSYLTGYFELLGSIVGVLGLTHVLTVEAEGGVKEVLLTYPVSRSMLAVERMLAGAVWVVGPLLLAAGTFSLHLDRTLSELERPAISLQAILIDAGASLLFLAGLVWLAAVLFGWLGGLLVGGLYWLVDLVSQGRFTYPLYLSSWTFPSPAVSPETNRTLLVVCGIVAGVGAVLAFGRNWRRG